MPHAGISCTIDRMWMGSNVQSTYGTPHRYTKCTKNISGPTIAIFAYYDLTLGAGVVVMWKLHKSWYSCKLAHLYGFLVVTLWSVEVFGAIDVRISGIIFEIMGELAIVEDSVVPEKKDKLFRYRSL